MTGSKCEIDVQRTRELSIPELLVLSGKGDENHFFCRLVPEIELRKCPRCGNLTGRNQGKMHRDFLDALRRNDNTAVITISLDFRKSKCEAPGCGCVYYPEMTFASPNARTTRRLDNAIVRMVLRGGCSYAEIADEFHGKLSRQAVGNIFHRRVRELNADTGSAPRMVSQSPLGKPLMPSHLAAITFSGKGYLVFQRLHPVNVSHCQ